MNTLQREIYTLTETSPGDFVEPQWEDYTEVAFKDHGSRRAALVALRACGQIVALRSAQEQVTAAGGQFRADGKDQASKHAIGDAEVRVARVRGLLAGSEMSIGDGNLNNQLLLERRDADLMIDAMEELPKLAASEKDDMTTYYAAVTPSLLETAILSVDGGKFRYEF